MNRVKKLGLFDENRLQDLSFIRGGSEALSVSEMSSVIFEEEGASVTLPFGRTTHLNCWDGGYRRDYAAFGLVFWTKGATWD
jgi:hypothetical protein